MNNNKENIPLIKIKDSRNLRFNETDFELKEAVSIFELDNVEGLEMEKTKVRIISNMINQLDVQEITKIKDQLAEALEAIKVIEEGKETGKEPALWMTAVEKLGPTGAAILEMYLKSKGAIG